MKRKIAMLSVMIISLQLMMSVFMPVTVTANEPQIPTKAEVPSVKHEPIEGNLFPNGSFDTEDCLVGFEGTPEQVKVNWISDENGGYIEGGKFPNEYTGFRYNPGVDIPAGKYKLTFYARTLYAGHKTLMTVMINGKDGKIVEYSDGQVQRWFNAGVGSQWVKVEYCFELKSSMAYIHFRPSPSFVKGLTPICIDEVSLVAIDELPEAQNYMQGIAVAAKEVNAAYASLELISEFNRFPRWDPNETYKVEGLMLNLDNTAHGVGSAVSEQVVVDWANQFKGTHVTDIVMNIAESKCVYPSEVYFGWYGDGKTTKDASGNVTTANRSNSNGYVSHFITRKLDYLRTLSKVLPEMGINMWMSIRMNDAHDRTLEESGLFTEYFFNHPEYRRVRYKSYVNTYYAKIWDYTFPEIRQIYLALLNESLDRYDVYGYQFEWQREMWNFYPGGEYAGLEILNQFYRDADAIIKVYEGKYGHEIKFSATVAPDLQTNYDFGLDVLTWASEDILDMVVPMGRWSTSCNETPVSLWKSMMEPYGVEVAPCIEHGMVTSPLKKSHDSPDIEMYTGVSALYLSQGADKIQIHNILIPFSHIFKEKDKVAAYDPSFEIVEISSSAHDTQPMWWVLLTSCGSYEKLMTLNRKVIPTYNDVAQTWNSAAATAQLPISLGVGRAGTIRIGMGDIPEGARVSVNFSASMAKEDGIPEVAVNGQPCTFTEIRESTDPDRTEHKLFSFEVPESVYDDMIAVIEITPTKRPGFSVDYAEIYIEPAK